MVFTIGYDGPAAVVDNQAKRKYRGLSTKALAEKGLFRAAYASALYSGNPEEMSQVEDTYRRALHGGDQVLPPLDRLFGVFPVEVQRSISL